MAKQILVTEKNLHLISYRLQQFLNRHQCISMQGFYRYATTTRYNQMINPTKHIDRKVEKTDISYMVAGDAKFKVIRKDNYSNEYPSFMQHETDFIRINYAHGTSGFLIEPGDKISFAPTRITINSKHPNVDGERMLDVWLPADVRNGTAYTRMQIGYANDYYTTCDEEYKEQRTKEELEDDGMVVKNPPSNGNRKFITNVISNLRG